MIQQIKRARRTLAENGWVGPQLEPWCRDGQRRKVHHHDEGVRTFSVSGALQLFGELAPAWQHLGRLVSPGVGALGDFLGERSFEETCLELRREQDAAWPEVVDSALEEKWWQLQVRAAGEYLDFGGWLVESGRTVDEVLRVFTTAALRARR